MIRSYSYKSSIQFILFIMAYCDSCGNFDESHREALEYPKDGQHCIQDYQPDLYYYWDSPIAVSYTHLRAHETR